MSVIENIIDIPAEHEKNVFGQFDMNIKKINGLFMLLLFHVTGN